MITPTRRGFLFGLAALAAPAIVRATSLMPVSVWKEALPDFDWQEVILACDFGSGPDHTAIAVHYIDPADSRHLMRSCLISMGSGDMQPGNRYTLARLPGNAIVTKAEVIADYERSGGSWAIEHDMPARGDDLPCQPGMRLRIS